MLGKNDFLFDKRLAERFIERGQLMREDYQNYLDALPDVRSKSQPLVLEEIEQQDAEPRQLEGSEG